ncbi:hypothetical protein FA95DRAFT_1600021 [Auriscalpium vulgare]|uniref:Uncharacterized protein n=1 Tax=Auriscalpium vulgare TaxID=40419 RepID=A0ACB8R3Y8_9AGAM|nr:hypothetical protein FA95DRAFT_1600021 [Auriscalpium vulgare]
MAKETDIYDKLEKAGVQRIAKLGCGGDLPGQSTRSQDFTEEQSWACFTSNVYRHTHCRMTFLTIGAPLQRFSSTKELCVAIYDALTAHSDAYTKAKILHRDVSAGNILIDEEGRGLLIDWDLCRDISLPPGHRRQWRTGTWQFISAALLLDPLAKPHTLSDDLESFCHVLTYMIVKYRPTKFADLREEIHTTFDSSRPNQAGTAIVGGAGKTHFFGGTGLHARGFLGAIPTPCFNIIQDLRKLFAPLYLYETDPAPAPPSSTAVIAVFEAGLHESQNAHWKGGDPAMYIAAAHPPTTDGVNRNGKRSRAVHDIGPLSPPPGSRTSNLLQSTPDLEDGNVS